MWDQLARRTVDAPDEDPWILGLEDDDDWDDEDDDEDWDDEDDEEDWDEEDWDDEDWDEEDDEDWG